MPKPNVKCPHCSESFHSVTGGAVQCPGCGKSFSAPVFKALGLRKTCPNCGEKIEGGARVCPKCGSDYKSAREDFVEDTAGSFAPERKGIRSGMLGGLAMIAIGVVWFFVGLYFGRIFYYAPILAVIGVYALVKGAIQGNVAGEKPPRRGIRRR